MNICYVAADFSGPGSYRCLDPGRMLAEKYGWNTYSPEPKEKHHRGAFVYDLGNTMPDADIYVLQQRPEVAWLKIVPRLQALGRIVVAETDDYYAGLPLSHPAYQATRHLVKPLHQIYRLSNAMTVSTPFLKKSYSYLNSDITVVPNFLDWELWKNLPSRDWTRLRIGWQGEAKMRPDDMRVLIGLIGPWLEAHPEVDFVAAGDPRVHDILGIPEKQRITYPRVLFHEVPSITATMDVGLVPLAESDFNQAKSYLKGMEYAACGIPSIASPSESYRAWAESSGATLLARRPHDWLRALDRLVGDETLRREMGARARNYAATQTIQRNVHLWHDLFERLAGDKYARLARTAISRQALQKPSEFSAFLRFLQGRKLQTVVEIGTAQGGTLGALCSLATDDALIVSIDLPGGDVDETSEDDKYGARDTGRMAGYRRAEQRLEFLQMDSHHPATRATLERTLVERTIDLLFIDGDHTYEGVKQDFEMYSPFVSHNGCIAFHDILTHDLQSLDYEPGVDRLWKEIKEEGYDVREFVNTTATEDRGWGQWGGIGVVVKD